MINTTTLTNLAGTSLPVAQARRRGSVLVLAVGVLALMSIMVVVYVTLGQNDRRSGAASQARVQLTTQSQSVRDYLAQVIADGATSVVLQRDVLGNDHVVRKAWDYPSTDEQMLSVNPGAPAGLTSTEIATGPTPEWPARRFDPSGNTSTSWVSGQRTDPRTGGTPFLAAAEPTFLNYEGDAPTDPARLYIDFTDWAHISNFAPDGRFVNLAAIRGNFNAEVGFGADRQGRPRTSELVTLLDTPLAPSGPTGRYVSNLDRGDQNADPNRPAHFSARQRGAARPMNDPRFIAGDPRRIDNQWRDTDGDGIADARIFELIDASEPDRARPIVPETPGVRTFVAARAIDLSGLVNVNTARNDVRKASQRTPNATNSQFADPLFPVGLTPADVSLERLLTLRDVFQNTLEPLGQIPQPTPREGVALYESIDVQRATRIGESAFSSLLFAAQRGSVGPAEFFAPGRVPPAPAFASQAYQNAGVVGGLAPLQRAELYRVTGSDPSAGVVSQPASASVTLGFSSTFGLADELELRTFNGRNNSETLSRLEVVLDGRSAEERPSLNDQPISADRNLGPMRSNRPLAVERSLTPDSAAGARSEHDQPLDYRAQRALANMDVRSRLTTISGDRPIATTILPAGASPLTLTDGELRLDISEAMSRVYVARDLPSVNNRDADPGQDPRVTPAVHASRLASMTEAANRIFQGYADALMPFAGLTAPGDGSRRLAAAWRSEQPAANNMRVLHYGGSRRGVENNPAELALRTSAHMTLNLLASRYIPLPPAGAPAGIAPFAPRDTLFAATLLIDESSRPALEDNDGDPLPGAGRDINQDGQPDFPYWQAFTSHRDANVAFSFPLDLNRSVPRTNSGTPLVSKLAIAPNNENLTSRAVNIFAVTPQPFVVGAATFGFYTDMWSGAGGDEEFQPGAAPGDPGTSSEITIQGGVENSNADFLFEFAVIQIHNPWSEDIALSAVDEFGTARTDAINGTDFRYYIDFASRTYKLQVDDISDPDGSSQRRGAVVRAGKTVNVILLPADIDEIARRVGAAVRGSFNRGTLNPGTERFTRTVLSMIRSQVLIPGDDTSMVTGVLFNPETGADVDPTTISEQDYDFVITAPFRQSTAAKVAAESNRTVRLWRRVDSPDPSVARTGIDNINSAQWTRKPGNDYLVDRLRDPFNAPSDDAAGTLSVRLDATEFDIARTAAGPDNAQGGTRTTAADNTGYSVVRFASIFRPNDRGSPVTLSETPLGAVPAFCLEVKSNIQASDGSRIRARSSLNQAEPETPHPQRPSLDIDEFPESDGAVTSRGVYLSRDIADVVNELSGTSDVRLILVLQLIKNRGEDRSSPLEKRPGDNIAGGSTGRNQDYNERYVQIYQGRRLPGPTGSDEPGDLPPLLSTDLLRPLAVGPWHDPMLRLTDVTERTDPRNLDLQWTTLSEALALAADYDGHLFRDVTAESPVGGGSRTLEPDQFVYAFAGASDQVDSSGKKTIDRGAFDRGQLFIDRFIPFNDLVPNGVLDVDDEGLPRTDPPETPIGLGIPFALNILNNFRTQPYGSLQRVYQGRINVNTAPLSVLRTVGLLSPDVAGWASSSASVYGNASANMADPLYDPASTPFDMAASIIAYRDKARVQTRPVGSDFNNRLVVDFRDNNDASGDAFGPGDDNGRRVAGFRFDSLAAVGGPRVYEPIRETPGLQSIGELLAARMNADFAPPSPSQSADRSAELSIDYLARRNPTDAPISPNNATGDGLFGFLSDYYIPRTSEGAPQRGEIGVGNAPGSWQRQLDIAASAVETLTVRSDIFGVWFTVMGYTPSDVEGLSPVTTATASEEDPRFADPMVPTFERRYFMVVDRSNVTTRGQKPRILLFQELPGE
ncbi:MAG: hypothetical protein ACK5WB_01250 [Phycisphaerales bacterium]